MQTTKTLNTRMVAEGIEICFTSTFELRWNDRGSGASKDGAFWQPIPESDAFRPLGTLGMSNYDDPNGKFSAICIRKLSSSSTLLTPPMKFNLIWADHGSGADMDGSCWRPMPVSSDYVSMGDIFMTGYNAPSLDEVWCLHKSLVQSAGIGDLIWEDSWSGADKDFGAWNINASPCPFIGNDSHSKPGVDVFSLKMS